MVTMPRYCKHPECCPRKVCVFGPPNGSAVFCTKHKMEGHVDLVNKKCQELGCPRNPVFGSLGGPRMFCVLHKGGGHVNLKSKKCLTCGLKRALFGPSDGTQKDAVYCVEHKEVDHVNLMDKKCLTCGLKLALFGPSDGTRKDAMYCVEHCPPGYVDLVHKRCTICLVTLANRRYKEAAGNVDICARCFVYEHPDHKLARAVRIKERLVADALREAMPGEHIVLDKRVQGGCSSYRPDVFMYVTSEDGQTLYALIIECDEDQHKRYICENKRMMQLFEDCGRVPIVLVRFNPDAYTDHEGVRHTTCFGFDKRGGMPRVAPGKTKEWKQRLGTLLELVRACISTVPTKEVTIHHLFYDGYNQE